jgi:hypothetical protein
VESTCMLITNQTFWHDGFMLHGVMG